MRGNAVFFLVTLFLALGQVRASDTLTTTFLLDGVNGIEYNPEHPCNSRGIFGLSYSFRDATDRLIDLFTRPAETPSL
jgi:hypothetical protein